MFGIKNKDGTKEIAIFSITRLIKFAALKYGTYNFQNVKVNYKIDVLDELKNNHKIKDILGPD